jgi:osmotically inducible protein OsmC
MAIRKASAVWRGNLSQGKGTIALGSGAFEGTYSFASRFQEGTGTNPEELLGAAHAGCFSMALAHILNEAGFEPTSVKTTANVQLLKKDDGFTISSIELNTEVEVTKIEEKQFLELAEKAKVGCPISKALRSTEIKLKATLVKCN